MKKFLPIVAAMAHVLTPTNYFNQGSSSSASSSSSGYVGCYTTDDEVKLCKHIIFESISSNEFKVSIPVAGKAAFNGDASFWLMCFTVSCPDIRQTQDLLSRADTLLALSGVLCGSRGLYVTKIELCSCIYEGNARSYKQLQVSHIHDGSAVCGWANLISIMNSFGSYAPFNTHLHNLDSIVRSLYDLGFILGVIHEFSQEFDGSEGII